MLIKKSFILLLFSLSFSGKAQCPFGNNSRVECKYGCDNFTDKDGDGYCDYSRVLAKETTDTANRQAVRLTKTGKRKPKLQVRENQEETTEQIDTSSITSEETSTIAAEIPAETKTPFKKPYHLILISALTLGSYFFTFLLSRFGILHKTYHRRIWNTLLLLTAVVSCLFGFLLVIQLSYNILPHCYRSILTWHVECGIAMTIIAVFHVIWHIPYYKRLFKKVGN